MKVTHNVSWTAMNLTWKLLSGKGIAYTLVGLDAGNVRRVSVEIDGTQVGAQEFQALQEAPAEIQTWPAIKQTLECGPYINVD